MTKHKLKKIIGRLDILDFPALDLKDIDVKIDSGAYTSSFHCHNIQVENGILNCQFLDPEHEKYHEKIFSFSEFKEKKIKSSNGMVEKRYIITTKITVFNETMPIELSLTERGAMKYPVLLGRKFLSQHFLIDTSKKDLSRKNIKILK